MAREKVRKTVFNVTVLPPALNVSIVSAKSAQILLAGRSRQPFPNVTSSSACQEHRTQSRHGTCKRPCRGFYTRE